jgi:hypothetical protein
MSENSKNKDSEKVYMPRFLVTQEEYDKASPEEREKFNYVVDETPLTPPKTYSIPEEDSGE